MRSNKCLTCCCKEKVLATLPQDNAWLQRHRIYFIDLGIWQVHDALLKDESRFKPVINEVWIDGELVGFASLRFEKIASDLSSNESIRCPVNNTFLIIYEKNQFLDGERLFLA